MPTLRCDEKTLAALRRLSNKEGLPITKLLSRVVEDYEKAALIDGTVKRYEELARERCLHDGKSGGCFYCNGGE